MTITLRSPQDSDLPSIARIENAASANPWSEAQLRREFDKSDSRIWLASSDSVTVGFAVVWRVADEAQLAELAVDPAYRRRGAGRALLRKICEGASADGLTKVTLEVREGSVAARALYASEGFIETFRRPNFYENREAAVLMEKELR